MLIGPIQPAEYYIPLNTGPLLEQLYGTGQFFWAPSMFLLDNHIAMPHVSRKMADELVRDCTGQKG